MLDINGGNIFNGLGRFPQSVFYRLVKAVFRTCNYFNYFYNRHSSWVLWFNIYLIRGNCALTAHREGAPVDRPKNIPFSILFPVFTALVTYEENPPLCDGNTRYIAYLSHSKQKECFSLHTKCFNNA